MSTAKEFIDEVTRMSIEITALKAEVQAANIRNVECARDHLLTTEKLRECKTKLWAAARGCGDRILKISMNELDIIDPDEMILVEWKDEQTKQHCIRADVKGGK